MGIKYFLLKLNEGIPPKEREQTWRRICCSHFDGLGERVGGGPIETEVFPGTVGTGAELGNAYFTLHSAPEQVTLEHMKVYLNGVIGQGGYAIVDLDQVFRRTTP